jgi:hypothetical protein
VGIDIPMILIFHLSQVEYEKMVQSHMTDFLETQLTNIKNNRNNKKKIIRIDSLLWKKECPE